MSDTDALQELIDLVYEAAEEPIMWQHFLQDIQAALQQLDQQPHSHETELYSLIDDLSNQDFFTLLLSSLLPHVERAIRFSNKIYSLENERDSALGVIERLPLGVLLVCGRGTIHSMNSCAVTLLKEHHELQLIEQGKLRFDNPMITVALLSLINEVSTLTLDQYFQRNHGDFLLTLPAVGKQGAISLLVVPAKRCVIATTVCAGVLVTSSLPQCSVSEALLKSIFGLTVAEARLVRVLVKGRSVGQIAAERNISVNTARSQLKSIFRKTNTSRQTELVYTILMSSAVGGAVSEPVAAYRMKPKKRPRLALYSESTLQLKSGRQMGYAESGDPNGMPMIFCHSLFSSRYQQPFDETLLVRQGIRWIVPERPGYGLSDPCDDYSLLDWPNSVEQLADHLKLENFDVMGYSIGGAYAQACALQLPDRVNKLGLIASLGPVKGLAPLRDMTLQSRFFLMMGCYVPGCIKNLLQGMNKVSWKDPLLVYERLLTSLSESEQKFIVQPKIKAVIEADLLECFAHDTAGLSMDLSIACRPWGFDPATINSKIWLWHGMQDKMIPHTMNEALAAIPSCQARYIADAGHVEILNNWQEILSDFSSKPRCKSL